MPNFVFANNVSTTLATAISSGATTMTLASTLNVPTIPVGKYWALTLNDAATGDNYEIVYVTAMSGATATILRGQEGTSAQAWNVGDFIYGAVTAGELVNFSQSAIALPVSIPDGGTGSSAPVGVSPGTGINVAGAFPNQVVSIDPTAVVESVNGLAGHVTVENTDGTLAISTSGSDVIVNSAAGAKGTSVQVSALVTASGSLAFGSALPGTSGVTYILYAQVFGSLHDSNKTCTLVGGGGGSVSWANNPTVGGNGAGPSFITAMSGTAVGGDTPSITWTLNDSIGGQTGLAYILAIAQ